MAGKFYGRTRGTFLQSCVHACGERGEHINNLKLPNLQQEDERTYCCFALSLSPHQRNARPVSDLNPWRKGVEKFYLRAIITLMDIGELFYDYFCKFCKYSFL
jgi:hypothetical protein